MKNETRNRQAETPQRTTIRPLRSIAGGVAIVAIVLLVLHYWDREAFAEWKATANPFVFFGLLCVLPAFAVPTTPFFVLAGAVFNPWVAFVGSAVGVASSNLLCWFIAQSWLRVWLERILARFGYTIPTPERGKAIRIALLIKFAPGLPTVVKNYIMAMSGIGFWLYMGVAWSVTMVYAGAFILLGESVVDRDFRDAVPAVIVLVLVGLLFYLVRRILERKRQRNADASNRSD